MSTAIKFGNRCNHASRSCRINTHGTQDGAVRRRVEAAGPERHQRASSLTFGAAQGDERVGEQRSEQIAQGCKLRLPEPGSEERGARMVVAKQDALAPIEDEAICVPVAQRSLDRQRLGRYVRKTLSQFARGVDDHGRRIWYARAASLRAKRCSDAASWASNGASSREFRRISGA